MEINPNLARSKFQANQMRKKVKNNEFKQKLKNTIKNSSSKNQALKRVSEKFEALFVNMMFEQMKEAGFESKLLDTGLKGKIFKDMYYRQLAQKTAKQVKLGIAEETYQQLK